MTWLLNLLLALVPASIRAWFGVKQDQAVTSGVNQEKANEASKAVQNAADSQVINADVDRMSDDELRKSPYANRRD